MRPRRGRGWNGGKRRSKGRLHLSELWGRGVAVVAAQAGKAAGGKVQFAGGVGPRKGSGHTGAIAGLQGSHALGGLAKANALAVIPAEVTLVRAGDTVRCHPLGPIVDAP